jgi:hypothetical protein
MRIGKPWVHFRNQATVSPIRLPEITAPQKTLAYSMRE